MLSPGPLGDNGLPPEPSRSVDFGLNMYDVSQGQLVWRGDAAKTVEANITPKKRKNNIDKGVAKLLKDYPPKK